MFKNIFYIFMVAFVFTALIPEGATAQERFFDRAERYDNPRLENQPLDYDRSTSRQAQEGWTSFGCKWVDYDDDRLIFHVRPNAGFFKKIKVKVSSDQPYFIKAKIISANGERKKFNIASNKSFPGQGVEVKFSYVAQKIKRIILRYDARMHVGDRTKICVLGKKLRSDARQLHNDRKISKNRPFMKEARHLWSGLGCVRLGKKIDDAYIQIKTGRNRLQSLRFRVKRSPVIIQNLELTYQNGKKQQLRVGRHNGSNKVSKFFRLTGNSRLVAIDIRGRSRSLFRSAKICFEGVRANSDEVFIEPDERRYRKEERYQKEEPSFDPTERRFSQNKSQNNKGHKPVIPHVQKQNGADLNEYIEKTKKLRAERNKRTEQERLAEQKSKDAKRANAEAEAQARARKSAQRRAEAEAKRLEEEARDNAEDTNKKALAAQKAQERADAQEQRERALEKEKLKAEREAQKQEATRQREQARQREQQDLSAEEAEAQRLSAQAEQKRLQAMEEAQALEAREKAEAEQEARAQAKAKQDAEAFAQQNRLAALAQKKAQRLAEIKKKAAAKLAAETKIHSKKADFPKFKVSPGKTGWVSYGCQKFGTEIEELYIPVGRMQGTFTKVRVKAMKNSLTLKKMIVVYGNGRQEPLIRYSSRVRMGEYTSEYKLSHKRRFISEVKLKAKARDYQNKEKVLVCLEAYR